MPMHVISIWDQLHPMLCQRLSSDDTATALRVDDRLCMERAKTDKLRITPPLVFDVQTTPG